MSPLGTDPGASPPADTTPRTAKRSLSVLVGLLFVLEVVVSIALAWINPQQGYDENWYVINAYRFQGISWLPYAHHRPPLLPLLIAVSGEARWLLPAIAHVTGAVFLYLLLGRLTTRGWSAFGLAVYVLCGDLRLYNLFLLTELPTVALMLAALYAFVRRRPAVLGAICALLVFLHWSLATFPPVVFAWYVLQRRRSEVRGYLIGLGAASAPFLAGFTLIYGQPFGPLLDNFAVQQGGANDLGYYLRTFPQFPLPVILGAAALTVAVCRKRRFRLPADLDGLCFLTVGTAALRLILLHLIVPKEPRFLLPLLPMLLLLSILAVVFVIPARSRAAWVAGVVLLLSVLPGRRLGYTIHDLRRSPTRAIAQLAPQLKKLDPLETVYTELNDLAVMGITARRTVAVTGPGTWHHPLLGRPSCSREQVPPGAVYLTFRRGDDLVLAETAPTRLGTLALVRRREAVSAAADRDAVHLYATPPPAAPPRRGTRRDP